MPLHVHKRAMTALGISESFVKGESNKSILASVVMRADLAIDGFVLSSATVGEMDITEKIIEMYKDLEREDINLVMLNGYIISGYNVMDLHKVVGEVEFPLFNVTYKASKDLEKHFMKVFPEEGVHWIEVYHRNGSRIPIQLQTIYTV